jgi:hypothetical protein
MEARASTTKPFTVWLVSQEKLLRHGRRIFRRRCDITHQMTRMPPPDESIKK